MRLNKDGAVDVNSISLLQKPCISEEDRATIQHLYNNLRDQMKNYAVRWQYRRLKKKFNSNKFKKCYFCINQNGLLKPFAKVFLVGKNVEYSIVERHLSELNLPKENAEYLALMQIFRPTISDKYGGILFSIFSDLDMHFHILEENYNGTVLCVPYQLDTSKLIRNEPNDMLPENEIHIFHNGIIVVQ